MPKPNGLRVDDVVVIAATLSGFGGGLLLLNAHKAPIVISLLFATAVTALIYRYLGGIQGASYAVGALKLTGSAAVLIGGTLLLNQELVKQLPPLPLSAGEIVGEWKWVYGKGAWEGHLDFQEEKGQLHFTGEEFQFSDPNTPKLIYRLSNGTAILEADGQHLTLEADVEDLAWQRQFRLHTTQPMVLVPAFRGDLRPMQRNGPQPSEPWGMMIYKRPVGAP